MSTFTAFLWKEWRSQRALLIGFTISAFLSFAGGYLLAPESWFETTHKQAMVVVVFVLVGLGGGILVLAPQAVRGEFAGRDDQFLRRLPGALAPAFWAKVAFVAIAGVALPILGFLTGTAYLWIVRGPLAVVAAVPVVWDDGTLLPHAVASWAVALPWTLGIAFWMPGARMAVGAASLLGLVLVVAVTGLLRVHPGLSSSLTIAPHVPIFVAIALAIAWVSCVVGRRGGNHRRSALLGATTLVVGLVPQAAWLGSWIVAYRWPDVGSPGIVNTCGLSPDCRFALVEAAGHHDWHRALFRVDLGSGSAEQLTGPGATAFATDLLKPVLWNGGLQRRYWLVATADDHRVLRRTVFDLMTGAEVPVTMDDSYYPVLPPELKPALIAQHRATTPMTVPGGGRAWVLEGHAYFESPSGDVTSQPWPISDRSSVRPIGHGIVSSKDQATRYFDLVHRRFVKLPTNTWIGALAVNGTWLCHAGGRWILVDGATEAQRPATGLEPGDKQLGLLDETTVLIGRNPVPMGPHANQRMDLLAYRPASGVILRVTLPAEHLHAAQVRIQALGDLGRPIVDPLRRAWLVLTRCDPDPAQPADITPPRTTTRNALVAIDPGALRAEIVLRDFGTATVLAFDGDHTCLLDEDNLRIVRLDFTTGERTVLFPRPAR